MFAGPSVHYFSNIPSFSGVSVYFAATHALVQKSIRKIDPKYMQIQKYYDNSHKELQKQKLLLEVPTKNYRYRN